MNPRPTPSAARTLRCALLCVGLPLLFAGCGSWRAADGTAQEVFATQRPTKVRVTMRDGGQQVLEQPRVLGDVLAGVDGTCAERFGANSAQCPETGVPLFDVELLEVYRRGWATIVLPAVAGLGAAWLIANR